ncbi:MAG: NADH-quinone oxidoreductase subunit C [Dehalococcoidia bacterium]
MSRMLDALEVGQRISQLIPGALVEATPQWVVVQPEHLLAVATYLRDDSELDLRFLIGVTAVDYIDHFEVVYHLQSISHNHLLTLKTQALDHKNPEVPSVVSVWRGAELQEREIYDLMGIRFAGHPDLRRVFLWEGFPGHPLRKDWLDMPGGLSAGLERFPGED